MAVPATVDGAGQQPAAPVRLVARDPRRGGRGGPGARARRAGPGSGAGHLPRRRRVVADTRPDHRRDPPADDAGPQHRLGGATGIRRRQQQRPAVARCCRSTPRTWAPATPSTGCATQLPAAADRLGAGRRRRPDRADQRLRRPGVPDRAAGVALRRADRVRDAADLDPLGVPGVQGRADDVAVGGRRLRQPGDGLPVGLAGEARVSRRSPRSTAPFPRWCWR